MSRFTDHHPSLESYWRAVILFGRNVASYKFALGQSLLKVARTGTTFIPLADLAVPFAHHLSAHLKGCDKQATSQSSRFLDECRKYNRGDLSQEELVEATVKLGFNNVIDAFHVVGNGPLDVRFFEDERSSRVKGIRLTDELYKLCETYQHRNLPSEVEARWRLVETAWELSVPTCALVVAYDDQTGTLVTETRHVRRKAVAPCRDALNGYQKGKCFYCFGDVSVVPGADDLADVDHLFPHKLKSHRVANLVDGIWNLVLACQRCNRGEQGKFDRLPELWYLERLHTRNEFLIESHHPLRETLMLQTGVTEQARRAYLNDAYRDAVNLLVQKWKPEYEHAPAF